MTTGGIYEKAPLVLVAAAIALLLGDVLQLAGSGFAWTVVLNLAFAAFAAGLVALPLALGAPRHGLLVVVASAVAFLGSIAGASMQVLFRASSVLKQGAQKEALATLQGHSLLTITTLVPGILFPLGLLLLSAALRRRIGLVPAATLALGAVLFPIGHAASIGAALIAGDLVLLVAFILLSARINQGTSNE